MLTGLMVKGYLEPALFNKEKNSLEAERVRLLAEKEQFTHSANGDLVKIEKANQLLNLSKSLKIDIVTETIEKLVSSNNYLISSDSFIHSYQGAHYTSPIFQKLIKNII